MHRLALLVALALTVSCVSTEAKSDETVAPVPDPVVEAPQQPFGVRVVASGPYADQVAAAVEEQLLEAGCELLRSSGGDLVVRLTSDFEQLPGGSAGFRAWEGQLTVDVEPLPGCSKDGLSRSIEHFGPGETLYGTDLDLQVGEALEPHLPTIVYFVLEAADIRPTRSWS